MKQNVNKIDVSVITVNWNGASHIKTMIESLRKYTKDLTYEVIIVDNGSEKSDQKQLSDLTLSIKDKIAIKLIFNNNNYGFGKGCNIGAKHAKGTYLAFVNPDVTFIDNTLCVLLKALEQNPLIGLIGPKITSSGCTTVYSAMKKSSILSIALGQTTEPIARFLRLKTAGGFYLDQDLPHYCDWVYGSFMVLPQRVFFTVKGFDERYFMYAEEADLCLSIKKAGYLVRYFPNSKIVHEGEGVAKKVPDLTITRKAESEFKFFSKWNSKFYASINCLINGVLFWVKGVIYSAGGSEVGKKMFSMGKARLSLLFRKSATAK